MPYANKIEKIRVKHPSEIAQKDRGNLISLEDHIAEIPPNIKVIAAKIS